MAETQIQSAREEQKYYPYSGIFFVYRNSFWQAGQDSFTNPPAQNPDSFSSLINVEPTLNGTLQRRRGYTLFSKAVIPTLGYTLGYSFRNDAAGIRQVIWTSGTNVDVYSEQGNLIKASLFTPSATSLRPRMVQSTNFGYFSDGNTNDSYKWDGNIRTNWGTDVANSAAPVNKAGGTAAQVDPGSSYVAWTAVSNFVTNAGSYASVMLSPGVNTAAATKYIEATNFSYAVASPPTNVQCVCNFIYTQNSGASGARFQMQLVKGGVLYGQPAICQANGATLTATFTNTGLSAADVNASNFGFVFQWTATSTGGLASSATLQVNNAQMNVLEPGAALVVGAPTSGAITLLSGRTYFYAFQNSTTITTSSLSPASVSTGPLTSQEVPLSGIPTSLDPQIDTVLILATADGNDQTTLYLVVALPNGTSTYTDNTPDTVLLTNLLYQYTDQTGTLHGIANNNRPPAAFFPTKHKGRIYMANGAALYFSKNLTEVTTANGLITSKYEEAWPAVNQIDISQFAETIAGLLSDGETLWIGTERSIRRLIGDSPSNFQEPEIQFNEAGLYNQDVWKICFRQGTPVGCIWLTPDFRVLQSDFNTYTDVGSPIQDVLNSINIRAQVAPHAQFVSNGPADYYILYIPTGSQLVPETALVYNLNTQKWSVWYPTDYPSGSLFFIDQTGAPRWLFSTYGAFNQINPGPIYEWTYQTYQDRLNNGPISYSSTMRTSWLDFGDRNLRKALNQILYLGGDPTTTVSIEGAVLDSQLDAGTGEVVLAATPVVTGPLQDLYVPLAGRVSRHRWYRITFTSIGLVNNAVDVLDGFSIEAGPLFRY